MKRLLRVFFVGFFCIGTLGAVGLRVSNHAKVLQTWLVSQSLHFKITDTNDLCFEQTSKAVGHPTGFVRVFYCDGASFLKDESLTSMSADLYLRSVCIGANKDLPKATIILVYGITSARISSETFQKRCGDVYRNYGLQAWQLKNHNLNLNQMKIINDQISPAGRVVADPVTAAVCASASVSSVSLPVAPLIARDVRLAPANIFLPIGSATSVGLGSSAVACAEPSVQAVPALRPAQTFSKSSNGTVGSVNIPWENDTRRKVNLIPLNVGLSLANHIYVSCLYESICKHFKHLDLNYLNMFAFVYTPALVGRVPLENEHLIIFVLSPDDYEAAFLISNNCIRMDSFTSGEKIPQPTLAKMLEDRDKCIENIKQALDREGSHLGSREEACSYAGRPSASFAPAAPAPSLKYQDDDAADPLSLLAAVATRTENSLLVDSPQFEVRQAKTTPPAGVSRVLDLIRLDAGNSVGLSESHKRARVIDASGEDESLYVSPESSCGAGAAGVIGASASAGASAGDLRSRRVSFADGRYSLSLVDPTLKDPSFAGSLASLFESEPGNSVLVSDSPVYLLEGLTQRSGGFESVVKEADEKQVSLIIVRLKTSVSLERQDEFRSLLYEHEREVFFMCDSDLQSDAVKARLVTFYLSLLPAKPSGTLAGSSA